MSAQIIDGKALAAATKAEAAAEAAALKAKGIEPLHPVTLTLREIKKIFMRMGFDVMEGPEIDRKSVV